MITKEDIKLAQQDNEYLGKLIVNNEGLIRSASKKYIKRLDKEEVLQEARLAFVKAVKSYKLDGNRQPHNYIYTGILNHLYPYAKSNTGLIHVPYECIIAHTMHEDGCSIEEICKKVERKENTVKNFLYTKLNYLSYDKSIESFEDNEYTETDKEILKSLSIDSFEDNILSNDKIEYIVNKLDGLIKDQDLEILLNHVINNISLMESYRIVTGEEEEDKQGRPKGYAALSVRIGRIRKLVKECVEMGYVM